MGAYTATYTSEYPASAGQVETGYSFPAIITGTVLGASAGDPQTMDGFWPGRDHEDGFLFRRVTSASKALTLVKVDGVWSAVKLVPASYDRLIGGGYESTVSLTELDELLTASLITSDQYNAALATAE